MTAIIARIQQELETLPSSLQGDVLLYIEYLKYKSLVKKVEILADELHGVQAPGEAQDEPLATNGFSDDLAPEDLMEKINLTERLEAALQRMKAGEPGISNEAMKQKVRQWRNR